MDPWRRELRDFLVTAGYVVFLGPVAGLIWWQLAPKQTRQSMTLLLQGSVKPFHLAIDADVWFLLVALIAGLASALVVAFLRTVGPGVVAGLAVGGAAAGVIADRVGYLAERAHTVAAMQAAGVAPRAMDLLDFKVRALGVIVAWPMAALIVYMAALALRDRYRSLP
jgi:hypothetical protein